VRDRLTDVTVRWSLSKNPARIDLLICTLWWSISFRKSKLEFPVNGSTSYSGGITMEALNAKFWRAMRKALTSVARAPWGILPMRPGTAEYCAAKCAM
jgi:hypothetical protein